MRYIKDILVEKAILHVVDVHADEAILTKKNLKIDEEVEEFVRKHVMKSLNDEETFKARFLSNEVTVAKEVICYLDDNSRFEAASHLLTTRMFDLTKKTDIPSGDMLFVQFIADERRCFGILKLDYQMSYMHNITFDEDELCIKLISQEVGLPAVGQRLKKCAFFTKSVDDHVEMIIVDKKQKIDESNMDYFVSKYLEAVVVSDDTDKTRKFKSTIEKWTQRNLGTSTLLIGATLWVPKRQKCLGPLRSNKLLSFAIARGVARRRENGSSGRISIHARIT